MTTTTPDTTITSDQRPSDPTEMTGLEQLRNALFGREARGIGALLAISVVELDAGRAVFTLRPDPRMLNPIGTVHGGIAAVLLDTVASCAVHAALPAGTAYATAQLSINYTRPILPDTALITGVGEVVHLGRSIATATGTVTDDLGRIVAHGSVTCALWTVR